MGVTSLGLLAQCMDLMWRSVEREHTRHGFGGDIKRCPNDMCREAVQLIEKATALAENL